MLTVQFHQAQHSLNLYFEQTGNGIAEQNAELVRRGYEAFNNGDMKTLTELFNENATWHTPGQSSIAGNQEGRNATFARFGRFSLWYIRCQFKIWLAK